MNFCSFSLNTTIFVLYLMAPNHFSLLCLFVEMAQLSSYDSGNPETPETEESTDVSRRNVKYSLWYNIVDYTAYLI